MSLLLDIAGGLVLCTGAAFLLLGGLGLVRMPDLWTRIQAGTKATTLGTIMVLAGAALIQPAWALKLLVLMIFILFTNPISSQVLARAAHRAGQRPAAREDHLADRLSGSGKGQA